MIQSSIGSALTDLTLGFSISGRDDPREDGIADRGHHAYPSEREPDERLVRQQVQEPSTEQEAYTSAHRLDQAREAHVYPPLRIWGEVGDYCRHNGHEHYLAESDHHDAREERVEVRCEKHEGEA